MSILDLLYREYCRARLAEMRQQLLLSVADEIPAANADTSNCAGPDDRNRSLDDDFATRKPELSGEYMGAVRESARHEHTCGHHGQFETQQHSDA
jgi:hypothetical protein